MGGSFAWPVLLPLLCLSTRRAQELFLIQANLHVCNACRFPAQTTMKRQNLRFDRFTNAALQNKQAPARSFFHPHVDPGPDFW